MTKRTARKRRGRTARKRRGGRGWLTFFLIVLIGFFGYSILLGRMRAASPEPPERIAPTSLPAPVEPHPAPIVPDPHSPTLVVWNGCGRDGLAGRAASWLRRQGFDVFDTGNADRDDYDETLIIQRSGRMDAGREVASRLQERLGIGSLVTRRAEVAESDVLLILGRDFPDSLPIY